MRISIPSVKSFCIPLVFVLALGGGRDAGATVRVATSLPELASDAFAIARGVVTATRGQWTDDHRMIETVVTLDVETYLKGRLGSTVLFRTVGGTLGRYRNVVVGAPQFAVGQHVVVFLAARGPAVPHVLGMGDGVFRLAPSASGGWIVRGAPLALFEQRVRLLVAGQR